MTVQFAKEKGSLDVRKRLIQILIRFHLGGKIVASYRKVKDANLAIVKMKSMDS